MDELLKPSILKPEDKSTEPSSQEPELEYLQPLTYKPAYPGYNPHYHGPRLKGFPHPDCNEPDCPYKTPPEETSKLSSPQPDAYRPEVAITEHIPTVEQRVVDCVKSLVYKPLSSGYNPHYHGSRSDILPPSDCNDSNCPCQDSFQNPPHLEFLKPEVHKHESFVAKHISLSRGPELDHLKHFADHTSYLGQDTQNSGLQLEWWPHPDDVESSSITKHHPEIDHSTLDVQVPGPLRINHNDEQVQTGYLDFFAHKTSHVRQNLQDPGVQPKWWPHRNDVELSSTTKHVPENAGSNHEVHISKSPSAKNASQERELEHLYPVGGRTSYVGDNHWICGSQLSGYPDADYDELEFFNAKHVSRAPPVPERPKSEMCQLMPFTLKQMIQEPGYGNSKRDKHKHISITGQEPELWYLRPDLYEPRSLSTLHHSRDPKIDIDKLELDLHEPPDSGYSSTYGVPRRERYHYFGHEEPESPSVKDGLYTPRAEIFDHVTSKYCGHQTVRERYPVESQAVSFVSESSGLGGNSYHDYSDMALRNPYASDDSDHSPVGLNCRIVPSPNRVARPLSIAPNEEVIILHALNLDPIGPEPDSEPASSVAQADEDEWQKSLVPARLNIPHKRDLFHVQLSRLHEEDGEVVSEVVSSAAKADFTPTSADSYESTEWVSGLDTLSIDPAAASPCQSSSESPELEDRVLKRKILWGEKGLLGGPSQEARPTSRFMAGMKNKLKAQLAEFVDESKFGLKRKPSNAASLAAPGSSPASLVTSLDSTIQAKLYAELEVLICNTANQFILEQYYGGRISQHSIDKVNAAWNAKNQHHVNEFRFDQATQRELIVANRRQIEFTGDSACRPACLQTNLRNWKSLAREMSVRTFCLPDCAIRKHLHDLQQILSMMNPKLEVLLDFRRLSSDINSQMLDKEIAARRQSEARQKRGF